MSSNNNNNLQNANTANTAVVESGRPAQTTTGGTMVVGGPMKCFIHFDKDGNNFTTDNYDVWNKHCHEFGHVLSGTRKCEDCDNLVIFANHPYRDVTSKGSTLVLRCDDCEEKFTQDKQAAKSKAMLKTIKKTNK